MSDERKLVTVLFADIVGSTTLTLSTEPEVLRDTLTRTFAQLSSILDRHGGTVEKFIGDEVMAVFGAPAAHDDDADRAVRAAFGLLEAVSQMHGSAMQLRIGVNTGEVLAAGERRDQFLVTGEPVVAAARLRAASEPGEILVGALTRRLTEPGIRYGRRRQIKAKGLGVIEGSQALGVASVLPEQRRGVSGLHATLIGREEELRLMRDVVRRVAGGGQPALVTILGPAGSGKSRLGKEFILPLDPARVLRGRCLPYGDGITFWPLQEMVRGAAAIAGDDSHDAAYTKLRAFVLASGELEPDAEAVARRLAVLLGVRSAEEVLPGIEGAAARDEIRWALRRLLDRLAGAAPLTLVFEDIHWAEPSLLDAVEHLLDVSRAPLCVLCLARPDLLATRPGWGGGKRNSTTIELRPLTSDETRQLIHELLKIDELPEVVRTAVVTQAEGNPLYVEEFLRLLIDSGQIERQGRRWAVASTISSLSVPPTLQGLIAARLDRLDSATKRTLQVGAVIGRTFWTDGLDGLGEPSSGLAERLADAVRRDLVIDVDERGPGGGRGCRFKHVLIRDVAYASIHKAERQRLHGDFARWLEAVAGDRSVDYADVIAYHAEQAFHLASELHAADAEDLGRSAFTRLESAIARARFNTDRPAVLGFCERALAIAATGCVEPRRSHEVAAIAALTRYFQTPGSAAVEALEVALAPLRAGGSEQVLIRGLGFVARGYVFRDRDRARALFAEALERAQALGDPSFIVEAMLAPEQLAQATGDEDERLRLLTAAYEYMKQEGLTELGRGEQRKRVINSPLPGLAGHATMRGDFSHAREYLDAFARMAATTGSQSDLAQAATGHAQLARMIGDHGAVLPLAEKALALRREIGDRAGIAGNAMFCGDARFAMGNVVGGRELHAEALALHETTIEGAGFVSEALIRLSADALALGDLSQAALLAGRARQRVAPDDVYTEATTRVQLGKVRAAQRRDLEAEELFRDAVRIWAGTAYVQDLADARRDLAAFLLESGRGVEARELLEQARDFYKDPLAFRQRDRIDALVKRMAVPAL